MFFVDGFNVVGMTSAAASETDGPLILAVFRHVARLVQL